MRSIQRMVIGMGLAVTIACGFAQEVLKFTPQQIEVMVRRIATNFGLDPDTPRGRIVQAFGRDLFANPGFSRYMLNVPQGVDPSMAAAKVVEEGLPFLADVFLETRIKIIIKMMETATVRDCAKLGSSPRYGLADRRDALHASFKRLSEDELRGYLTVNKEAMSIRFRNPQAVATPLTEEQAAQVIAGIYSQMTKKEGDIWIENLTNANVLTDPAYCEASLKMYHGILRLKGAVKSDGLRIDFSK